LQFGHEFIWPHFLFVGKLFLDEVFVVESVGECDCAFVAFFDIHLQVGGVGDADDEVDVLVGFELYGKLVVEGQIYDLLVVDADGEQLEVGVGVCELNLEEFVGRQFHDHCGVRGFLFEAGLFGEDLHTGVLIGGVVEGQDLYFEFVEDLGVGHGKMEVYG
jgi:hypothetical protein